MSQSVVIRAAAIKAVSAFEWRASPGALSQDKDLTRKPHGIRKNMPVPSLPGSLRFCRDSINTETISAEGKTARINRGNKP
jgi:hypothetical protein